VTAPCRWLVAGCFVVAIAPVVTVALPATVRIPRAKDHRPGAPGANALFSHRTHAPQHCYQCHPGLFPQALVPFTHADMDRGRFCGACHDGQRADAVASYRCESCHVPR
jgi:c(7)-type cytochrome triheme protein